MSTDKVESAVNHLIKYCMKENVVSVVETTCHTFSPVSGKCVNDIGLEQQDIDKIKSKLKLLYIEQKRTQNLTDQPTYTDFNSNDPQAGKFGDRFTNTNTKLRMLCYCLLYEYSKMKYSYYTTVDNLPSVMQYIIEQFDKSGNLIDDYNIDNSSHGKNNDDAKNRILDETELLVDNIKIVYDHVKPKNAGKSHKSRRTRKHSKKNHRKSLRRRRYIR